MFSAAKIAGRGASTSYNISRSLRFRSSASAYLSRTFGTPTNSGVWTFSAWVKRGLLSTEQGIFGSGLGSTGGEFEFIGDTLRFRIGSPIYFVTTPVYRDPSAWYHITLVANTGASGSAKLALYVNGVQVTAFSTDNRSSFTGSMYNTAITHYIGLIYDTTFTFDGYMAEVNFIDGQALTPTSFGAFNATTGVWQPLKYTGTYGNNGFYLPFSNNTSTTTLGADSSGNGNNWTCNNISLTAGTTYDSMLDVPTLTSATAANYPVANPLYRGYGGYTATPVTISNANLTITGSPSANNIAATMALPTTGQFYYEYVWTATSGGEMDGGIIGETGTSYFYRNDGTYWNGSSYVSYGASYTTNDVIGVAVDMTSLTFTFYKNGVSQGTKTSAFPSGVTYFPWFYTSNSVAASINFGQRPFTYTPPTGFVALNTYNLPTPTIPNGALYMAATTYTGNLTGQSITNGGNNTLGTTFQPDLVWIKSRSAATDHKLTDNVRGATKALISNSTAAETTDLTGLTTFNSNGFTVGASTVYNNTGVTYVGWQWLAGAGSSSSNTSGTITSTVSVNTTAGFSVVTYTGTGANATVGHGLGIAPSMIITKKRNSTSDWAVYHASLGNTSYLILDSSAGSASSSTYWNNTSPTSSVFSIGTADPVNISSATYVAYCFAPIAGYSAFGVYTGNGVADGPFTYTGFRPRYLILKKYSAAGDPWWVIDSSRSPYNQTILALRPSAANAEDSGVNANFDFLSNGFKARTAGGQNGNESGATYIWMAFAENPFKYSLAR
jgi:hypothetical protein